MFTCAVLPQPSHVEVRRGLAGGSFAEKRTRDQTGQAGHEPRGRDGQDPGPEYAVRRLPVDGGEPFRESRARNARCYYMGRTGRGGHIAPHIPLPRGGLPSPRRLLACTPALPPSHRTANHPRVGGYVLFITIISWYIPSG